MSIISLERENIIEDKTFLENALSINELNEYLNKKKIESQAAFYQEL